MLNAAELAVAERLLVARRALLRAEIAEGLAHQAMAARPGDVTRRRWLEALGRKAEARDECERVDGIIAHSDLLGESLARES